MENMPTTANDILELLRSREVSSRNSNFFSVDPREVSSRSREVYKEEKKEIQKESSRNDCEDVDGGEVSGETCLLASRQASTPMAVLTSSSPLDSGTSCQESGVSNNAERELSSRYSGISVQHVKTAKGVKVAITLQQQSWAIDGAVQMATAELKRYDRMREINATADDSPEFVQYLANTKAQLQQAKKKSACIGRLHHRGKRSAWIMDTLIVALFDGDNMSHVMLYLEGEEIIIPMTHAMSPTQLKYYHSAGIHGEIKSGRRAPRLSDLPLVKFGE